MSTYDPRRSRPTPKVVEDEAAAPVDALLGPNPSSEPQPAPDRAAADEAKPPIESERRAATALPVPVRRSERPPSALLQMAPAIVVAVLIFVVWMIRRNRR